MFAKVMARSFHIAQLHEVRKTPQSHEMRKTPQSHEMRKTPQSGWNLKFERNQ